MPAENDEELDNVEADANDPESLPGLRKAAREGKKAIDALATMQRENLFLRAGVDITTKLGAMLYKTFEGTDSDELKAEAIEIGALKAVEPDKPAPDPVREAQEAQRGQMYDSLNTGQPGGSEAPQTEDPRDKALKDHQTRLRAGGDEDASRAEAVSAVLAAAANGDKRVFYNKARHNAEAEEFNRMADARPRG